MATKSSSKKSSSKKSSTSSSKKSTGSSGWTVEIKQNGRTHVLTRDNALRVVVRVPTKLKGKDGRTYVLVPGKPADKNHNDPGVMVLTTKELFPFHDKMRSLRRPLVNYGGPKPKLDGSVKFILPGVSATK